MKKRFLLTTGIFGIVLVISVLYNYTMYEKQIKTAPQNPLSQKKLEEVEQDNVVLSSDIKWIRLVNKEHGYSIEYPAHWLDSGNQTFLPTIYGSSVVDSRLFNFYENLKEYSFPSASFEIKIYTMNPEASLEFIASHDEDRVKETVYSPASSISSLNPIIKNGLEGIRYTIDSTGTASNGGFLLDIVLKNNKKIFELEAGSPNKEMFFEYQNIFEHMAQSFQLL